MTVVPPVRSRRTAPDGRLVAALPTGRGTVPIDRARRHLAAALIEGDACPVCGQHAQLYRRKLHATMARDLIALYRATVGPDGGRPDYVHVPSIGIRGGDFAKLAHWSLIAEKPVRRGDGGAAGYWRITNDGVAFVRGSARVPGYVLIYDGNRIGFDGDPVGIDTILGDTFDLRDLQAGPLPPPDPPSPAAPSDAASTVASSADPSTAEEAR